MRSQLDWKPTMSHARRIVAAAFAVGVGALTLTGCIMPPPAPTAAPATPTQTMAQPAGDPGTTSEPAPPSGSSAPAGDYPFTVDDGVGDTWSFDVVELVADPPMESGEPAPGTHFVGVVISAQHLEGSASFMICFDILVEGTDGETYDWRDTLTVTAVDDLYFADDQAFTRAVAAVQLPEGVDPVRVTMQSRYGAPEVEDVVIDITN